MKKFIGALLIGGVLALSLWGYLDARAERAQIIRDNNAVADTFRAVVDTLKGTIEERGKTVEGSSEVEDALRASNSGLASELRQARALLLTHGRTIVALSDSLRDVRIEAVVSDDGNPVFPILWTRNFDAENFFEISGQLEVLPVDPPEGIVDLALMASLSLDVVVSRTPAPELALRCDAASGMPGVVTLTSLDCIDNVEDPLRPPRNFALDMFKPPALTLGILMLALGIGVGSL